MCIQVTDLKRNVSWRVDCEERYLARKLAPLATLKHNVRLEITGPRGVHLRRTFRHRQLAQFVATLQHVEW